MRFFAAKVTATVTYADGSTAVTPDDDIPFDRLMFERRFGMDWMTWETLREEYLYFCAWVQLNRDALASKALTLDDFDPWMVTVAEVKFDIVEPEGDAVLPTDSTVSTG